MSSETDNIVDDIKDVVNKGNVSRIVITKKDGEVILNLPVTVGAIGAAVGLFAVPWALIASVVATIGFGCGVEVVKSDGEIIKIR